MQIVSLEDNMHELLKLIFWHNLEKIFLNIVTEIFTRHAVLIAETVE